MVELNLPLQQDSRRAQERESEAMLSAAQARRENASNQVLANLAESLSGIEAARRTEVDFINGKFVEYGQRAGVDTPFNRTMLSLVKGLESGIESKKTR